MFTTRTRIGFVTDRFRLLVHKKRSHQQGDHLMALYDLAIYKPVEPNEQAFTDRIVGKDGNAAIFQPPTASVESEGTNTIDMVADKSVG